MWSKRTQDEPAQTPQRPSATPSSTPLEPQRREVASAPLPGARNFDPENGVVRSGAAALGKNVTVKGQIFAREDLTIDGEVEGTIECHDHRLTIGPNARVQASLKAREIIIHGSIQGNVESTDKIDIKKEAKLVGDIKTSRIVIEDGAYFKGSIDISKGTQAKQAAPPIIVNQPSTGGSSTASARENTAGAVGTLK